PTVTGESLSRVAVLATSSTQKAFAMLSEASPTAPAASYHASFLDEVRDELAIVKREAVTASRPMRAFLILTLLLAVAAVLLSINAHGRALQPAVATGPLGVRLATPDGKTVVPVTKPVSLAAQPANVAQGEKVSYAWTFGDGATGTGATVAHTYASYGF